MSVMRIKKLAGILKGVLNATTHTDIYQIERTPI